MVLFHVFPAPTCGHDTTSSEQQEHNGSPRLKAAVLNCFLLYLNTTSADFQCRATNLSRWKNWGSSSGVLRCTASSTFKPAPSPIRNKPEQHNKFVLIPFWFPCLGFGWIWKIWDNAAHAGNLSDWNGNGAGKEHLPAHLWEACTKQHYQVPNSWPSLSITAKLCLKNRAFAKLFSLFSCFPAFLFAQQNQKKLATAWWWLPSASPNIEDNPSWGLTPDLRVVYTSFCSTGLLIAIPKAKRSYLLWIKHMSVLFSTVLCKLAGVFAAFSFSISSWPSNPKVAWCPTWKYLDVWSAKQIANLYQLVTRQVRPRLDIILRRTKLIRLQKQLILEKHIDKPMIFSVRLFFQTIGLGETGWHHYSLSKRIFPVDGPHHLDLFTVFPVLYLKWYVRIFFAPAIFHCFMRPLGSWATHPSIFNLSRQKISCSKSGLVLWVVSCSSDDMPQNFSSFFV